MIIEVNFLQSLHNATTRDYYARMTPDKPNNMRIAKCFDERYWDGKRDWGYGGYQYDGRWKPVAKNMINHYSLTKNSSILDIGCGKGHLLHDLCPYVYEVNGSDISAYAINNNLHCRGNFVIENCIDMNAGLFDLTYSINVYHNLNYTDLKMAIKKMMQVSKEHRYICVESYRTEEELCNLQCWALTCQSFYSPDDWKGILEDNGYSGDLELIYFT